MSPKGASLEWRRKRQTQINSYRLLTSTRLMMCWVIEANRKGVGSLDSRRCEMRFCVI